MNTSHSPRRRRRHMWRMLAIGTLAIVVLCGAFLWWFFRDDSPGEVDIAAAAAQVEQAPIEGASVEEATVEESSTNSVETTIAESDVADASATSDGDTQVATGITGTWTVDTSIGEFSYEDSTGTFVGFRIAEELSQIGSTTAVGRTPEVTGTLTIDGTTVTAVTIEADMTSITTNEERRDDKVQGALDTSQFPTATFVLTQPIELGDAAASGETVAVEATGELTIHGVTQTVTIPLEAQLVDDTIVVVGSLDISFADFGVDVPSAPIVVSVEDHGPFELQLFFTRT